MARRGSPSGSDVPFALELCFRPGGELTGDGLERVSDDTYQLVHGEATYIVGEDRIVFGPGNGNGKGGRQPAVVDPGERYAWLGGHLTPDGIRVLITGRTPTPYRLTLR